MQPQVVGSAPAMQPAPISTPSPPEVGGKRPDNTMIIHTIVLVTALILAFVGMTGDAWSVEEQPQEIFGVTVTVESEIGLDDMSLTSCTDGDCTTIKEDLSDAYDNCTSLALSLIHI